METVSDWLNPCSGFGFYNWGYRIGYGGGYYDRYLEHFVGHTMSTIYPCQVQEFNSGKPWYSRPGGANLWRKSLINAILWLASSLPSNSIGISLDVGFTGLNFERADTLLQFGAMYGPIIRLFPEQIWRLFGYICAYRMGAFHCQYDFALLSWTTGGGDFRF